MDSGACFSCLTTCHMLCWQPGMSGCCPEIITSCHFWCRPAPALFNSSRLTSLSPLPAGAQMAAKGMLELTLPYLAGDKLSCWREQQGSLRAVWADPCGGKCWGLRFCLPAQAVLLEHYVHGSHLVQTSVSQLLTLLWSLHVCINPFLVLWVVVFSLFFFPPCT